MPGKPRQKVFCQGITKTHKRPCQMKGYPLANGTYKCKYHGFNNILGFRKPNYNDETRIRQLKGLYQFRNKTHEEVSQYYYDKVKPRIRNNEKSRYYRKQSYRRLNLNRNIKGQEPQPLTYQLDEVLRYLKKNPDLNSRVSDARKIGIQTLIDKLLQVFNHQEVENPNQILWIREKTRFIQYLAGKLTDLYSDNKPIKQNIDQRMTITWEDCPDLIEVSSETLTDSVDK